MDAQADAVDPELEPPELELLELLDPPELLPDELLLEELLEPPPVRLSPAPPPPQAANPRDNKTAIPTLAIA